MLADRGLEWTCPRARTGAVLAASLVAHVVVICALMVPSLERVTAPPRVWVLSMEPTLHQPCARFVWRQEQRGCVVTERRFCAPAPTPAPDEVRYDDGRDVPPHRADR